MSKPAGYDPMIKICGLTSYEDAKLAADLGADLLGVIMDRSVKRHGDQELVKRIKDLGKGVVGVYTDMRSVSSSDLNEDFVQLHFPHTPDEISSVKYDLGKKVISVVKLTDVNEAVSLICEYHDAGSDFILLERKEGISDALSQVEIILKNYDIGISGGINASNIDLLLPLEPSFVDLSSSVESSVGKKDEKKMRDFFAKLGGDHAGS